MILSFNYQLMMFIVTVVIGSIMGISYDAIRVTRKLIKRNGIIVQVEDAAYWITAAIWAFMIMFDRFDGQVRIYNIVGIGIGMAIYFSSLSIAVLDLANRLIKKGKGAFGRIIRSVRKIFCFITYPVKKLIKLAGIRTKKVLHLCEVCAKLKIRHFVRDIKTVLKK